MKMKPRFWNMYVLSSNEIKILERDYEVAQRRYRIMQHSMRRVEFTLIPDLDVSDMIDDYNDNFCY